MTSLVSQGKQPIETDLAKLGAAKSQMDQQALGREPQKDPPPRPQMMNTVCS